MPDDDITFWKQELATVRLRLKELVAEGGDEGEAEYVSYLKTRIDDIDRHVRAMEQRRT